jgi:hypothetical protein
MKIPSNPKSIMKKHHNHGLPGPTSWFRSFACKAAIAFLAVGVGNRAFALTAALSDCYGACSTPNGTECTTACNSHGCPGTWTWASPENINIQSCSYTSSNPLGGHGIFTINHIAQQIVKDQCAIRTEGWLQGVEGVSVSSTDTLAVSASFSLGVQESVNASFKAAVTSAEVGVQTTAEFTAGSTYTSSKTVTSSSTSFARQQVPGCGKAILFGVAFSAPLNASATLTFTYEGKCNGCTNTNWIAVKSCNKSVSASGSGTAFKWTACEKECLNVPNEACQSSATAETVDNGQCAWNTYP